MTALDATSSVLLLAGSLFALTGGVGLLRFPDFYTRTHAAGLMDSAGAVLILLGLLLRTSDLGVGVRLLLIAAFLLITGPTATHALAHAARNDGVRVWAEREDKQR
ncbi:MAG TPA: monovalent cation/H(+) antiporter subunit G [Jiangellaceae bacterium]